MSQLDETHTTHVGWPTAGPIQQMGERLRAGVQLGTRERPDRRVLWIDTLEELQELGAVVGQLADRWQEIERRRAADAGSDSPPVRPVPEVVGLGLAPAPASAAAPAPAPVPAPTVPVPTPLGRAPFEPRLQPGPLPEVSSAVPVPPTAAALASEGTGYWSLPASPELDSHLPPGVAALAEPESAQSSTVRPYVMNADLAAAGEVVPDPHRRPSHQ